MAKGIKSITRTVALKNNAALASGSNLLLTEVDMGTTRNGLLIINIDVSTTEYLTDMHVVSSATSDNFTSGTAAAASDTCAIVQDTVNSTATTTIASKKCSPAADGIYVYNVHDLSRYVNIQYTGTGTSTLVSANLIGLDLEQAPHATAQAAY